MTEKFTHQEREYDVVFQDENFLIYEANNAKQIWDYYAVLNPNTEDENVRYCGRWCTWSGVTPKERLEEAKLRAHQLGLYPNYETSQ